MHHHHPGLDPASARTGDSREAARTASSTSPPERPATYRQVFASGEFRTVFTADVFSLIGDQIAAVAVAVLFYQRSGSALLAALGYATAYAPWLLGGPLLAAWAERYPGRSVLVGCDLARAALIGLALIPGMPLLGMGLLVLAAAMLAPPFDAARSALLPQVLPDERYAAAMSLRDAVHQTAQLIGFAAGGALVLLLSAHGALAIDALTFAFSGLVLRLGLRHRPAPTLSDGEEQPSLWTETVAGFRIVRAEPLLRGPLLLGVVGAAYAIVPEAIAPAYAASLGQGPQAVGLIMGAVAGGAVIGELLMGRLAAPSLRQRLMYPLALVGTTPLLIVVLRPGLTASLALFAACGAASSYQVAANVTFARAAPPAARARVFGVATWGMYGGQLVAIVLAGAAAQVLAPATVVAGGAVLGAVLVVAIAPPDQWAAASRGAATLKELSLARANVTRPVPDVGLGVGLDAVNVPMVAARAARGRHCT
jgi:MFS family permease